MNERSEDIRLQNGFLNCGSIENITTKSCLQVALHDCDMFFLYKPVLENTLTFVNKQPSQLSSPIISLIKRRSRL